MLLSEAGAMVYAVIANLDSWHPRVHIDVFQVMPDHIHAIVVLRRVPATTSTTRYDASRCDETVGAGPRACPRHPGCSDPPKTPRRDVSQSSDRDVLDRCCASCVRWCRTGDGATRRRDGVTSVSSRGQARGPAPTVSSLRDVTDCVVNVVARETPPREIALPDVVQHIKSLTTARYRHAVADHGWPRFRGRLWQRNYYERIIRNDRALANIRRYIRANPSNWIEAPRWR
jgi:putative transposase